MKLSSFTLFALISLAAPVFASDDVSPSDSDSRTPATEAVPVGRYQMSEFGNVQVMVDTATGRVWQVSRRGLNMVLIPAQYSHGDGIETPLPDYEPPSAKLVRTKPDPSVAADRITIARDFVRVEINEPIMAYTGQLGEFPPNLASLSANLRNHPQWRGPYLRQTLIDPWGNTYRYLYPGEQNKDTYDVWSLGPDGVPSEDDIGNW